MSKNYEEWKEYDDNGKLIIERTEKEEENEDEDNIEDENEIVDERDGAELTKKEKFKKIAK